MDSLYVCHFSNGHIKVGRSIDPVARIAAHADRVGCLGIELVEHYLAPCTQSPARERLLIDRCIAAATRRDRSEWFVSLDYAEVCAWASECAAVHMDQPLRVAMRLRDYFAKQPHGAIAALARKISVHRVLVSQWAAEDGRPVPLEHCAAIETATDGAVCRWHLRPDDWHRVWPELVGAPGAPAIESKAAA